MSQILDILTKVGAIITGSHFVLTSGNHSDTYINKDALYPHTKETSQVCRLFAEECHKLVIDTVAGPALGGIILSQWTAHHLSEMWGKEICGVYTEKALHGSHCFARGYDKFVVGKRVLVVEDLTSTGGSAKKVVDAIRAIGGEVAGVCVIVNRNPDDVNAQYFGAPFLPLAELKVKAYSEADCLLCKRGVPINSTLGHGKKYLESRRERA